MRSAPTACRRRRIRRAPMESSAEGRSRSAAACRCTRARHASEDLASAAIPHVRITRFSKRVRHLAQLDPEKGEFADDITYSSVDGASPFTHPLCANTWRNGKKIGDEANATGY